MEFLSQLPLVIKSQTGCGCFRFLSFVVSWPVVIKKLDDFQDKDRFVFNCAPKPSDATKQRCYNSYLSTMSPLVTPLYFSVITLSFLGLLWVCIGIYGVKAVSQIKGEEDNEKKEKSTTKFWRICLSHVAVEVLFLVVMMVLFCCSQTLSLPEVYRCIQQNVTTHSQMENVTCNDQFFRDKSHLNFVIVGIMAFYICVCVATMVYFLLKRKNFMNELVQWESSNGKFNIQYADQINEFP